jgi:sugar (pentulose or hexulose) kinase
MPEATALPLALGLDLGTSAFKAALLTTQGEVLASGEALILTASASPGAAEQDPSQWLTAAGSAVSALDKAADAAEPHWRARVSAIGLTGQLPTLVVLGEHGVLGPAITWKDARADATAAALIGARRRELYESTGMPIDGRYLAPMYHHHWRKRRAQARTLLSAKDYLCFALTGARLTDPSTAAGYGLYDLDSGRFSKEWCALWGVPRELLPEVRPACSIAGPLHREGARILGLRQGIPVTVGAADSVSGAFAMDGLTDARRVCVAMGSSTVILDAVGARLTDPKMRYLLTPHMLPHGYAREMDLLATGTGHRWMSELFGFGPGELERLAGLSPPGARGVTFAPYLAGGEQGALWDPTLRGAVQGLTLHTDRSDLARAYMEGVGFEIRRCIEVLAETNAVAEVVLAGHLAEIPFALQMLADILARPVQPFPPFSPAALGAALGALRVLDAGSPVRLQEVWPKAVSPGASRSEYESRFIEYLNVSSRCGAGPAGSPAKT